jgi:hypothetical protein
LIVKMDFDGFKDSEYERFNDILYRAIVTDATTGRSEPRNFSVRLTHHPVHIYLRKLGGNDRMKATIWFRPVMPTASRRHARSRWIGWTRVRIPREPLR